MCSRTKVRGLGLLGPADLADHHHGVGLGVLLEQLEDVPEGEPLIGSPPMPTEVETPIPRALQLDAAS
jgi:hypothetical protein